MDRHERLQDSPVDPRWPELLLFTDCAARRTHTAARLHLVERTSNFLVFSRLADTRSFPTSFQRVPEIYVGAL
jgi:hypothetical protein